MAFSDLPETAETGRPVIVVSTSERLFMKSCSSAFPKGFQRPPARFPPRRCRQPGSRPDHSVPRGENAELVFFIPNPERRPRDSERRRPNGMEFADIELMENAENARGKSGGDRRISRKARNRA